MVAIPWIFVSSWVELGGTLLQGFGDQYGGALSFVWTGSPLILRGWICLHDLGGVLVVRWPLSLGWCEYPVEVLDLLAVFVYAGVLSGE